MISRGIGSFEVPAIGFGCMNLNHAYATPVSPQDAARTLRGAFDLGVRLFDTAALYGFGRNEELVGPILAPYRDQIVLASKCGMHGEDGKKAIDGRPETIRRLIDLSLARLRTDVIDLYYLHRVDPAVPVEESIGAMAELVTAGKVRLLGLSEVSAATIKRAHAVHPIAAVQSEYSLWTRNPELGALTATQDIGAAFVAFSPLARGVLTQAPPDLTALPTTDIRQAMPRFSADNYPENLELRAELDQIAAEAGCTLAQLALSWLLSRGPNVLAIPGARSLDHVRDNWGAVTLTLPHDVLDRAGAILSADTVHGPRYPATQVGEIDSEAFDRAG
jgi:aryl-alcohol dehydrogenase-like predicted oxidoreductase